MLPVSNTITLKICQINYLLVSIIIDINYLTFIFLLSLILIFKNIITFRKYYIFYTLNKIYYTTIIYIFLIRIVILLIRKSLLLLCVGWEGLGLTSYLLVLFYNNWRRLQGRFLTFITNRFGDIFIISILLYWGNHYYFIFILIILLISITKSAIYPYSSWLPAAIAAPTPVSSLVHSRTLVTAGLYLFFRFKTPWFSLLFKELTLTIGIVTFLLGSLSCLISIDFKKIVAFSTLSQLGFMLITFYSLWAGLIIFQLLLHAFLKRFLFINVGSYILVSYSQRVLNCSINKQNISQIFILLIIIINFIRIIFTRGFILKETVMLNIYVINYIIKIFYFLFIIRTLYYIKRFFYLTFYKFSFTKLKYNKNFNFVKIEINYYVIFLLFRLFWVSNILNYFICKINFKLLLTYSIFIIIINYYIVWIWKYLILFNNSITIRVYTVISKIEELFINNIWVLFIYRLKIRNIKWKSLMLRSLILIVI